MRQYFHEILYLLGGDRRKLPWMILLFLASSMLDLVGLSMVAPYIALLVNPESFIQGPVGHFLKRVGFSMETKDLLIFGGIGLLGIFLFKAITGMFINIIILRFSWDRQTKLRTYLMKSYQQMPYTDYLLRNSSEYIQTIHGMVGQFVGGVIQPLLRILSEGIVGLVILSLLAWTNFPALALLVVMLSTMLITYDRLIRRRIKLFGQWANEGSIRLIHGIHEGIEGFKEIRILGKDSYFRQTVREGAAESADNQLKSQILSSAPRYLLEFVMIAFVVLFVIGSVTLGVDLQMLVPILGLFVVAALRLTPSVNQLINSIVRIRLGRYATSRIYADLKLLERHNPEHIQHATKHKVESFSNLILNGLSFRYPNAKGWALKDLSMSIHIGESIGLIGPSGSGKTTLVDVLLGLLEPQKGELLYNGHLLKDALTNWRSQVAYLPQQIFLIDNTLRCNVALGLYDPEIDDLRLHEVLKQARLTEVVKQLPQGINTMLGERGVRLSGGQRQRVALARAFYHGRSVLVMDEATSSLDQETEREIVEEIKHIKGQKTLIVIAHSLSTVQHCDRIYRLEKGRIVEEGSYEQVIQEKADS